MKGGTQAGQEAGFEEALKKIKFITSWGVPVHLHVPGDLLTIYQDLFAANIQQLGVERLYAFTRNTDRPLVNSVGCFGRQMGSARIL